MSDLETETVPDKQQDPGRWALLRDVIAFQFKLAMDGLRDVLLSPISIVAAIVGVLTERHEPGKYFYRLLEFGARSDQWINLFNNHDPDQQSPSADHLVKRAEQAVLSEYEKGGVVQTLKGHADLALDKVQTRTAKRDNGESPSED